MANIDFENGFVVGTQLVARHLYSTVPHTADYNAEGTNYAETLLLSPLRFQEIGELPIYYDNATTQLTYAQIPAELTALETDYPGSVVIDAIGVSFDGRTQYAIRINDDGQKPIVGFSMSIHGNEKQTQRGMFDTLDYLLSSVDTLHIDMMEKVSVFVIVTVNPDGMATDTRDNGNGVNLNRNYPYYWEATLDANKGDSPMSEIENQNVATWLNPARMDRIQHWLDVHGWESKTTYGYLHEQMYHDMGTRKLQRVLFHHIQGILSKTTYGSATALFDTPTLTEYLSARKPYIYTYIKGRCRQDAYTGIIEYPENERVGITCKAIGSIMLGSIVGTYDYLQSKAVAGLRVTDEIIPVNQNSDMQNWNETESRPDWFSLTGLTATKHVDDLTNADYIETERHDYIQWLYKVGFGGYCDTGEDFFIAGGGNDSSSLSSARGENMTTGVEISLLALPIYIKYGAMCTDGRYLYHSGGYSGGYRSEIYRLDLENKALGWELWSNLSFGRQRHSMCYHDGKLIISCGRSSSGYRHDIRTVDTTTKDENTVCYLGVDRGYHTSTVYDGTLFIFGGFYGSTVSGNVVTVDVATWNEGTSYLLPQPVAYHSMAVKGEMAYMCLGENDTEQIGNIYRFNMSTMAITDMTYTLDSDFNDDGDTISIPAPRRSGSQAYYNIFTDTINIVGGDEDATGFTQTVYEFDIADGNMSLRQTFENEYGFLRASAMFPCSVGQHYSLNVAVRNPQPINDYKNPYIRIMILTGPLDGIIRKVRNQYIIPPQDEFGLFSIGFDIEDGETEFRAYMRHYGKGTKLQISDFQILNSNTNGMITPSIGVRKTGFYLDMNDVTHSTISMFMMYGSELEVNETIFEISTTQDSTYKDIQVRYISVPEVDKSIATGVFKLKYTRTDTGFTSEVTLLSGVGINHAKNFSPNREDIVNFRFYESGADTNFEIWVSNRQNSITLSGATIKCNKLVSHSKGVVINVTE